ncbi:MAG: hypothetical protein KIT02_00940 [Devosia sp.]|uniref:hypothetical protein n=1 Tax=Devosia sp. TaxID=1871048 RepID=UPI0024C877C4|nr:hypothetical protein [Devosia sp.]UYN99841.1 MAG: hypothetical protein KIT02_00940 [Devosia sp.]
MRRPILSLLVGLLVASPVLAQSSADPRMTVGHLSGNFTLHYYGQLDSGTPCPPAPNLLKYGIEQNGRVTYVHNAGLDPATDPHLAPAFTRGSFCHLEFSGEVIIRTHHGSQATILPASVGTVDATTRPPDYSGPFQVEFAPIMCQIPPCPPGKYEIDTGAGDIVRVDALVVVDPTGLTRRYQDSFPDFGGTVRGALWLASGGREAFIRLDDAGNGN